VRSLSSYNLLFSYFVCREHLRESEVCAANQALGRGLWERRGARGGHVPWDLVRTTVALASRRGFEKLSTHILLSRFSARRLKTFHRAGASSECVLHAHNTHHRSLLTHCRTRQPGRTSGARASPHLTPGPTGSRQNLYSDQCLWAPLTGSAARTAGTQVQPDVT